MHNLTSQLSLAEMLNDSSIDRVMAIDLDHRIISWNRTSEKTTGILSSDVLGRKLLDAFPVLAEDKAYIGAVDAAFKRLKSFLPADRNMPHRQMSEMHFIPLIAEGDELVGVMMIAHDVSHRIKAEQQLQLLNQQLEKKYRELERASNELSTFTVITSTNIKEPMRHIYTGLEFLVKSEGRQLSDTGKASLRRMQSSLNRMNLLINDILSFSQISNPETTRVAINLKDVVQSVTEKLRNRINELNAELQTSGDWPAINGHRDQVEQLLYHLIDNAIKFQPEGNRPVVTISASNTSAKGEGLPGEYVRLSVSDNGIGFTPTDAIRIFSLFEKLHGHDYRGSGMGLAISRKIMELHDGFILTESTPGVGSVFQCYFPVND
ncbi:MAG: PAS domain S-box protein [Chitinophagaceae bacterium]|nr:MAG: PAS domain S-box protein [Chitinophagaceae bacterium]